MLEIPGAETAFFGVKPYFDFAVFEDHPVLVSQHRKQHTSSEIRPGGIPIYVEIIGEPGISPPFENIEPPAVVTTADRHVVGDDVKDEAHPVPMQCIDKLAEPFLASELRIELIVVDDVIAMDRAWASRHDRRSVDMADPELGQIRDQLGGIVEREAAMELQPIGRANLPETVRLSAHLMVVARQR